jgi:hypothetical protein
MGGLKKVSHLFCYYKKIIILKIIFHLPSIQEQQAIKYLMLNNVKPLANSFFICKFAL